jgi:hypothetical protein
VSDILSPLRVLSHKVVIKMSGGNNSVGVVALDMEKINQMAADEVSRISSALATTSADILKCGSAHERRLCVAKAMCEYDTAVKWVQVIMSPQDEVTDSCGAECKEASSKEQKTSRCPVDLRLGEHILPEGGNFVPGGYGSAGSSAPPPPAWSALGGAVSKTVPPPPNHPPSLPIGRLQSGGQTPNQIFGSESVGSWSNHSSAASLDVPLEITQPRRPGGHFHGNAGLQMDSAGSCSNRSSNSSAESVPIQVQMLQQQGSSGMATTSNNFMQRQQPQQPTMRQNMVRMPAVQPMQGAQPMQTMQNSQPLSSQPMQGSQQMQGMQHVQPMCNMQNSAPMVGMQNTQPLQGMQNSQQMLPMQNSQMQNAQQIQCMQSCQPMQGLQHTQSMPNMQNAQPMPGMQGANNFQVIALPVGSPPPQGAILAANSMLDVSTVAPELFQAPMHEIFPQDFCQPANNNKFRIINPSTGEEVQPQDNTQKKFRIVNPGTGKEVFPEDKENVRECALLEEQQNRSSNVLEDAGKMSIGASWDWPLSRHEIREHFVELS